MPFKMSRQDNVGFAKRNVVDIIYREARIEGFGGNYVDAKAVCEGGIVNGLRASDVIVVNNLKHAWQFLFETIDETVGIDYIRRMNAIIGANTGQLQPGEIRTTEVSISGTRWRPEIPNCKYVGETLAGLYDEAIDVETRVLSTFARICRGQFFMTRTSGRLNSLRIKNS